MYNNDEVIMYLRKSRADRIDETVEEVLEKHETILQEYALKTFGYKIPEPLIYREVVSGETIADRPEMQRVLSLMEKDNIKGVLVVEPQRLSRGDLVDCGTVINAFRYTKTSVLTPYRSYDLTDKYDRKFFEMELSRGNDYLEYTKEILVRGRIASLKKGNFIGSIPPYGYKKIFVDKQPVLEIIPAEAEAIKIMYDLYVNKNYGFTAIANYLDNLGIKPKKSKHWSPPAIKDMLENPVYCGKLRWNWRKSVFTIKDGEKVKSRPKTTDENEWLCVDGKHEPIISEELYKSVLEKRGKNIRVKSKVPVRNPFAGLLYCECGRAMSYRTYCKDGIEKSPARLICDDQTHCKNKSVLYSEFEEYILQMLESAIADFEVKLVNNENNNSDSCQAIIDGLEKELERLERKDDEQHDLLEEGFYTKEVFIKRNIKLQEEKERIKRSIRNARETLPRHIDYRELIATFTEALDALKRYDVDPAIKNMLLKKCIEKITYSRHTKNRTKYDNTPFTVNVQLRI